MKRIALALLLTMFGLPLVPSAQAKEAITRLKVCGASHCTTIADLTTLEILMTEIGDESVAPPARARFYSMRPEKTGEWRTTWPHYLYVPSSNAVRVTMGNGDRYWDRVGPLLKKVTRDLKPNPTPEAWSAADVAALPATGEAERVSLWTWFTAGGLVVIVVALIVHRARRWRYEHPRTPTREERGSVDENGAP